MSKMMERHPKHLQRKSLGMEVERMELSTRGTTATILEVKSTTGETYLGGANWCTCDWGEWHPFRLCSHEMARLRTMAKAQGRALSFWATKEEAERQRRRMFRVNDIWVTSRPLKEKGQ